MKRIFVFAYNQDSSPHPKYRGHFNGNEFIPKIGSCNSIKELYQYDYIELFGMDGMICHVPNRFCSDVLAIMQRAFSKEYGEMEQFTLFD